ncbi:MAG: phage head closure protein [Oscillospiraceae bacterium]
MAQPQAEALRNRVEIFQRVAGENALGELCYTYAPIRKIWAQIIPLSGTREPVAGGVERVAVTHRVIVRRGSLPELASDMRLRYRGQDYEISYFYPNYQANGWLDLFCRLVVDNGIQSF